MFTGQKIILRKCMKGGNVTRENIMDHLDFITIWKVEI